MILIPNVGSLAFLDMIRSSWDPWVHLYINDAPLELQTILTDFTQAGFPGYSPVQVTAWTTPEIAYRRANTDAPSITFLRDGSDTPQDCWGYYVTDGQSGGLLWAERFERPPILMREPTHTITIVPHYSFRGEVRRLKTGL